MTLRPLRAFVPNQPDEAGVVTWAHIGDLHMESADSASHRDLRAIVARLDSAFASGTSFVFVPGDIANNGDAAAYAIVRSALDELVLPWCAIIGDHDVHEESFANVLASLVRTLHSSFVVGDTRFLALNAFDRPHPAAFGILPPQLAWIEDELRAADHARQRCVVLVHCYPSDLHEGGPELTRLLRQHRVRVVDMGHTHYNEISNDGLTLFTTTRSTGQIEEGPVGYSITNLDGDAASWRFFELTELPAVMITSPADARLERDDAPSLPTGLQSVTVRAKVWSDREIVDASAWTGIGRVTLTRLGRSNVWQGRLVIDARETVPNVIGVHVVDGAGRSAEDVIRVRVATDPLVERKSRDQDHSIGPWREHGLLDTRLGPNKNGHGW